MALRGEVPTPGTPDFTHCLMMVGLNTEVLYKFGAPYSKKCGGAIRWNDPAHGIDWPGPPMYPNLSDKDEVAALFADLSSPFTYEG